jgi:hypothetical protein
LLESPATPSPAVSVVSSLPYPAVEGSTEGEDPEEDCL